jgi:hypothetical protein
MTRRNLLLYRKAPIARAADYNKSSNFRAIFPMSARSQVLVSIAQNPPKGNRFLPRFLPKHSNY